MKNIEIIRELRSSEQALLKSVCFAVPRWKTAEFVWKPVEVSNWPVF